MGLRDFLDKYDTVIFDMDGVITSEQNYWNSAALTVWEYLSWSGGGRNHGANRIDTVWCMEHTAQIRQAVFGENDELITILKGKGVNSNWDLAYVTVLISWIVNGQKEWRNFSRVCEYAETLPDNILDAYDMLAREAHNAVDFDYDWLRRGDMMWRTLHGLFQEWFLGDELNGRPSMHGRKEGLLKREKPLIPMKDLTELLWLLSAEKRVCTGTGRPLIEMRKPLAEWGVIDYFAPDGLCCYDHVERAEKLLGSNKLTKPHPYIFLKALYGDGYEDEKIIEGNYDRERIKRTLIVGDAGADMLAAKAMGADFCAVLTGVRGGAARAYFEANNAEYILSSAADMLLKEE